METAVKTQATIMLVDDSKVSRMMSGAMVKKYRIQVNIIEAADGNAALALLEQHKPDIGIIDMNMPGMTGLDLIAILKQRLPNFKAALLTANGQEHVQKMASDLGVYFFRKPITEPLIVEILKTLLPE
ncbi:response regulator [Ampullimonas aquatilis]|uniref:response regulator n=1 Tax=Ampullimonas aquatilis TaxID=1341549 RepID=UPI003C762DC6